MRQRRHVTATAAGGQISQNLKDPPEEKLEELYPCLSEKSVFALFGCASFEFLACTDIFQPR